MHRAPERAKTKHATLYENRAKSIGRQRHITAHQLGECTQVLVGLRLLGAFFHTILQRLNVNKRVFAVRGFRTFVFCHAFQRRMEATSLLVLLQLIGTTFHKFLPSFCTSKEFSPPEAADPLSCAMLFHVKWRLQLLSYNCDCSVQFVSQFSADFLHRSQSFRSPRHPSNCVLHCLFM